MMRHGIVILKILGLMSAITGSLVLGCIASDAMSHHAAGQVLITGSLG